MKLISGNIIGDEGVANLGNGVSKLLNLANLNLDLR
jgi:hypothetical protein